MASHVEQYLRSDVAKTFDIIQVNSDLIGKLSRRGVMRIIMNLANAVLLPFVVVWRIVLKRPSVVHICTNSFGGFYEKGVLGIVARLLGRRVVMHIHGGGFGKFHANSSRLGKWMIRRLLFMSHRIAVLSEQMQETVLAIGMPQERIRIIENAVLVPKASIWDNARDKSKPPDNPAPAAVTVIFLNRINIEKGVKEFIGAAGDICRENSQIQCLMYGPETAICQELRSEIDGMNMSGQIKLPGAVTGPEKEDAYMSADIYVLPSHVEGMPVGLLEAMSYGLPCIASSVGGIPSVIDHRVNGVLIEPQDTAGLRNALTTLIADPALRRSLGTQARKTVETKFSWRGSARKFVSMYNELIFEKETA